MYLVYKALDGETVPHILPSRLVPPSKRSLVRGSPNVSPGVSPTPNMVSATVSHVSTLHQWSPIYLVSLNVEMATQGKGIVCTTVLQRSTYMQYL